MRHSNLAFAAVGTALLVLAHSAVAATGQPRIAEDRIVLYTKAGPLVLGLYPDVAPQHVEQLLKLVRLGLYDGTHIFRVERGFVAQIANVHDRARPLTKPQKDAIRKLKGEFSSIPHTRGRLSMARHSDPDSAETSFSVLLGKAPHLDGQYTVFGEVEGGEAVLDEIERAPIDDRKRPLARLAVARAEVVSAAGLLGALRRASPNRIEGPAAAPPSKSEHPAIAAPGVVAGILVMMILNLAAWLLEARVGPAARRALVLLSALVGWFVVVVIAVNTPGRSPGFATAILAGSVILFRLMGRLEDAAG